jgi:hypothetical protein
MDLKSVYKEFSRIEHPFPNDEIRLMEKLHKEKILSEKDFETIAKLLHKYLNLRADVFYDE